MHLGGVDALVALVALNITLSGLQWILERIKDKTQSQWDDRALAVVDYLLTMLNWIMANRGGGKR